MLIDSMYSTASFFIIGIDKLDDLVKHAPLIVRKGFFFNKKIDVYFDYLNTHGTELESMPDRGHILWNLLNYLKRDKGINLLTNEYGSIKNQLLKYRNEFNLLITVEQKEQLISKVIPTDLLVTKLRNFNNDFSNDGDETTTMRTYDAMTLLYKNLLHLTDPSTILLLIIREATVHLLPIDNNH
jgi:hypothetical protein